MSNTRRPTANSSWYTSSSVRRNLCLTPSSAFLTERLASDPNGLDGRVGDLILVPRSQNTVIQRGRDLLGFQDDELPGSVTIDDLPEGSAVIVHSALIHGRRAKPGGEDHPRYFTDVSFCQHSRDGRRWPSYRTAGKHTAGGHAELYSAHEQHGRHETLVARRDGIFDLTQFWDVSDCTDAQRQAVQRRGDPTAGRRAKI